jgi:hypothetical protein
MQVMARGQAARDRPNQPLRPERKGLGALCDRANQPVNPVGREPDASVLSGIALIGGLAAASDAVDALSAMEHNANWDHRLQADEHRRGEQAQCTTAVTSAGIKLPRRDPASGPASSLSQW